MMIERRLINVSLRGEGNLSSLRFYRRIQDEGFESGGLANTLPDALHFP
jgi:hypothetical protein